MRLQRQGPPETASESERGDHDQEAQRPWGLRGSAGWLMPGGWEQGKQSEGSGLREPVGVRNKELR